VSKVTNKVSKKGDLHKAIVNRVLPCFAEKLKKEGVISAYDRQPFIFRWSEDWPSVRIDPDLVLHLPDGKKILVEVANPRDPKRFIGESVYPYLLGHFKRISAAIVFVLHIHYERAHSRSFVQKTILSAILKTQMKSITISWSRNEEVNYKNLKSLLTPPSFLFQKD